MFSATGSVFPGGCVSTRLDPRWRAGLVTSEASLIHRLTTPALQQAGGNSGGRLHLDPRATSTAPPHRPEMTALIAVRSSSALTVC